MFPGGVSDPVLPGAGDDLSVRSAFHHHSVQCVEDMQVSDHFLQPGIPQQFIQLILPDAEFYPPAGLIVVVDHRSPVISVFRFFSGILGGRGIMQFCRFVNSNAFIDRAVQKFVGSEKSAVRAEDIESGSSEGMIQIVEEICVDQLRVI